MVRLAAPLRALAQRFSFLLLVLASVGLMMMGKIDTLVIDTLRARVLDAFSPILDAVSEPAATAAGVLAEIADLTRIRAENVRLREENARLMQWQQAALRLEAENRSLRTLLHFKPDPAARFVSARIVADPGGAYVRTVVAAAGRRDGVRRGQAVMAGYGLIGRVVEAGEWSARILLVTDLNARVPVVLEASRARAVLSGDNSDQPRLLYMPPDAQPSVGDRIVTSGHGGLVPPGLPVGTVAAVADRLVKVQPLVDLGRVDHVEIVDFGLGGGINLESGVPGALP